MQDIASFPSLLYSSLIHKSMLEHLLDFDPMACASHAYVMTDECMNIHWCFMHTKAIACSVPMNLCATHPRASNCQHSLNDSDLSARTSTTALSENQDDDGDDDDEPLSLFLNTGKKVDIFSLFFDSFFTFSERCALCGGEKRVKKELKNIHFFTCGISCCAVC
jgi:hypothetical protein